MSQARLYIDSSDTEDIEDETVADEYWTDSPVRMSEENSREMTTAPVFEILDPIVREFMFLKRTITPSVKMLI